MHSKAEEIAQSNWILETHAFSFPGAYTEYVNPLWVALTAIFALLVAEFSIGYRKSAFWKMAYTFLGVFFVAFSGWLGSLVVDTHLLGGMVNVIQNFPNISQLLHVVAGSLLISGVLYLVIQEFKIKTAR